MSWQMKFYVAVNVAALAYCAYHAVCIVRESRRGKKEGSAQSSLASLLAISGALEVV